MLTDKNSWSNPLVFFSNWGYRGVAVCRGAKLSAQANVRAALAHGIRSRVSEANRTACLVLRGEDLPATANFVLVRQVVGRIFPCLAEVVLCIIYLDSYLY